MFGPSCPKDAGKEKKETCVFWHQEDIFHFNCISRLGSQNPAHHPATYHRYNPLEAIGPHFTHIPGWIPLPGPVPDTSPRSSCESSCAQGLISYSYPPTLTYPCLLISSASTQDWLDRQPLGRVYINVPRKIAFFNINVNYNDLTVF